VHGACDRRCWIPDRRGVEFIPFDLVDLAASGSEAVVGLADRRRDGVAVSPVGHGQHRRGALAELLVKVSAAWDEDGWGSRPDMALRILARRRLLVRVRTLLKIWNLWRLTP
jgi:hypothetical protein